LGPLVYVTADVGESCGDDFVARLWGVWELAGNKLVDRNAPDANGYVEPEAAADVDGDGVLEILIDEGILRRAGDRYGAPEHLDLPDHDCPC
jgi:hypothetical protein